jgi:uncharacterized protein (DUF1778 family)
MNNTVMRNHTVVDDRQSKASRINLRTTAAQETLIKRAAVLCHKSVTEFILDSACDAAVNSIADQRVFVLADDAWERFQNAIDRPAQDKPRLKALLAD